MAGNWRIRHKLMLGVALILVVMGLLVTGTLKGLFTFKAQMRAFDNMIGPTGELHRAEELRNQIRALLSPPPNIAQQYIHVTKHLQQARTALDEYTDRLQENMDDDRGLEQDYSQKGLVRSLREHLNKLDEHLKEAQVPQVGGAVKLLAEQNPVRKEIDTLNRTANDLVNNLNERLSNRVKASRSEQRTTVWVLAVTSITAVLLMVGMFAVFYRSVVRPLRTLQRGVGGVARGDFSRRIEIHSGDEIQDLADAFNEMTGRLREMYASLAQQVNERSRQLVRSERLAGVGFLAAGVAHEINNPLASIAFCSEALERRLDELLRQRPADAEEKNVIAKYLKMIQEEAFRCKEITEKLLAFSRGGERKRERIDLAEIVQGVLDVVQHLQNCKGKQLVFGPREPILAWANGQEIKQVFLNLVVNALDSMDEGGSLTITHGRRAGMVELVFRDTGCGMSTEVLENLFEPFFTRNRTGKGTGLGLSISHRIITQHGGEIEAASDGPGKGSTFVVRLPIDAPAETAPETEADPDPKQLFAKLSTARKVA